MIKEHQGTWFEAWQSCIAAGLVIASLYVAWASLPIDSAGASSNVFRAFKDGLTKLDAPLVLPVFFLAFFALVLHGVRAVSLVRRCFLDPALTFTRDFCFFAAGAAALIAAYELYPSRGFWPTLVECGLIAFYLSIVGSVFHLSLMLPRYLASRKLNPKEQWAVAIFGILGLLGNGWLMYNLQPR